MSENQPAVLELRKSQGTDPRWASSPELEAIFEISSGRRLLCAACGEPITTDEQRISIAGRHVHRRVNPVGVEFEFGSFSAAPGSVVVGQPTTEFAWFAGYSWVYAICRGCGAHLGWLFEGHEPRFFALILNRLEEEPDEPKAKEPESPMA